MASFFPALAIDIVHSMRRQFHLAIMLILKNFSLSYKKPILAEGVMECSGLAGIYLCKP